MADAHGKIAGAIMPVGFNFAAYESVQSSMLGQIRSHYSEWVSFSMGWTGLAFRLKAASDFHERFIEVIRKPDPSLVADRYDLDHHLFGFCSSALSAIECYFYSVYSICSILGPECFPATRKDDLRFYPKDVRNRMKETFSEHSITEAQDALVQDSEYRDLVNLRNLLSHRGMMPFRFDRNDDGTYATMAAASPQDLPKNWAFSSAVDELLTGNKWSWISNSMAGILDETASFCKLHFDN